MNLAIMAAGMFAGGPIEDAINIFTAEKAGDWTDLKQGIVGGQEKTSIGAMAEIIRNVGIGLLTPVFPWIGLPLAGIVAATEFFQGDIGDAIGALFLAVPAAKALGLTGATVMAGLKGAKSGIKAIAGKSKDLYKLYKSKGAIEFSKDLGTMTAQKAHQAKNGYLKPFLESFTQESNKLNIS